MNDIRLLFPMAALVLVTFLVAAVMLIQRIAATRNRRVSIGDFRLNIFADDAPTRMLQAARNYTNLFEMTVLFYAVCLAAIATRMSDDLMVQLAWVYVVARAVHSLIHITINNVLLRMTAFFASVGVVGYMWVRLVSNARAALGA
ncbi:MAG: MAPEG family protein [Pseudomonadota bacterium]